MVRDTIPAFTEMMNPTLEALRSFGGSATIYLINDEVASLLSLTVSQLAIPRHPDQGGRTIVEERLSWARTYLKKVGLLANPKRGIWSLTQEGLMTTHVDPAEVRRRVQDMEDN